MEPLLASSWAFHGPESCGGRACPFHAPSRHHMVAWPIAMPITVDDLVIERVCPHGILHPDPDSLDLAEIFDPTVKVLYQHPCCGCCVPNRYTP